MIRLCFLYSYSWNIPLTYITQKDNKSVQVWMNRGSGKNLLLFIFSVVYENIFGRQWLQKTSVREDVHREELFRDLAFHRQRGLFWNTYLTETKCLLIILLRTHSLSDHSVTAKQLRSANSGKRCHRSPIWWFLIQIEPPRLVFLSGNIKASLKLSNVNVSTWKFSVCAEITNVTISMFRAVLQAIFKLWKL